MENHFTERKIVTPEELGALLKITGRTVLNWEKTGILKACIRVGRTVRFDVDEVAEQLATSRTKSAAAVTKP